VNRLPILQLNPHGLSKQTRASVIVIVTLAVITPSDVEIIWIGDFDRVHLNRPIDAMHRHDPVHAINLVDDYLRGHFVVKHIGVAASYYKKNRQ